jgi:N-acetyl-beta-hexosaminidase
VSVSLAATDTGSGVAAIRYTTDGSDPTGSSTLYSGPFNVSATTTVRYRAWDAAGNVEPTNSRLIRIDSTPPVSSIACNGAACSSGWYNAAVSVSLSATDTGSGVDTIRYTTDGSDPTIASPVYLTPFTVSVTTTVRFRAWDLAGNAEATRSQQIRIDTAPPVSSIGCNGAACSSGWYAPPVSVALTATDTGSGVAAIRYTLDGSNPTGSSTLYTGPFNISTTTTVKFRAWDVAGNVEATRTQVIQVDGTAPSVSITSPANGATVTGNVKVIASPSDSQSGVASVAFYVDGTTLIGTVTSSPWQVPWNTKRVPAGQHVLTAVATDRVGNPRTSAPITVTVR